MSIDLPILKAPPLSVEANVNLTTRTLQLRLAGVINEQVHFRTLFDYVFGLTDDVRQLIFDVKGIQDINSSGLRSWMLFLKKVQEAAFQLTFAQVSEPFLERANIYPDMLGPVGTPVEKFEAPYRCPRCDIRSLHLLDTKAFESGTRATPPPFRCESCHTDLLFDELESEYFRFLRRLPKTSS
ncbi:MAG: hypothetical protein NDJ90_06990 [Oligoflexia bacterium]|nr:hypothetical protein [Oligoflexia bacterium]